LSLKKKIKNIKKYIFHNPVQFWNDLGGERYYRKYHSSEMRNEDVILEKIKKYKPQNIIDIGCGYGRYLKAINEAYPEIKLFGVDIAESQIEKAKDFLSDKNISLFLSEENNLPFPDDYFDMAMTYGCISAVKRSDLQYFLSEIIRVTKNVGVFIEYFPQKNWNIFTDSYFWFKHDYHLLFKNYNYLHKKLNEIGDNLFVLELWKQENQ